MACAAQSHPRFRSAAWAGCPCTNMARTRLSRSNVCFRKVRERLHPPLAAHVACLLLLSRAVFHHGVAPQDIWWNADNALMHYLQCQHGSHHHSFAFFKGEFYGNGLWSRTSPCPRPTPALVRPVALHFARHAAHRAHVTTSQASTSTTTTSAMTGCTAWWTQLARSARSATLCRALSQRRQLAPRNAPIRRR